MVTGKRSYAKRCLWPITTHTTSEKWSCCDACSAHGGREPLRGARPRACSVHTLVNAFSLPAKCPHAATLRCRYEGDAVAVRLAHKLDRQERTIAPYQAGASETRYYHFDSRRVGSAQPSCPRPQRKDHSEAQAPRGAPQHVAPGGGEDHPGRIVRSEEHTSELQSPCNLVCRL